MANVDGRPAPPPNKGGGAWSMLTVGCEAASSMWSVFVFKEKLQM